MHNIIAGLVFLCLFSASLNAQNFAEQLDQLFEAAYAPDGPGASILISRGDKIIYERQIGLANVEHSIPISAASVFSVGSITKQFTVAALMQLEEQGKLRLSDTLQQLLPSYPFPEAPITLRQLVNHTSGLKDYPRIKKVRQVIRNEPTVDELIEMILVEPVDFPPGTAYSYSNSGYLMLGKVIEKIAELPFEVFLKNNILIPAGMEASNLTDFLSVLPNRTTPYSIDEDRGLIRATSHAYSFAAGGLLTTAGDLHKWMRALLSNEIVGQAGLNLIFGANGHEKEPRYYGWEVNEISGNLSYEHTGFEPGYKASSIYLPESDLYITVLQNTEHSSPTPPALKAAAICLKKPYPARADHKLVDQAVLERFTGRYAFSAGRERIINLDGDQLLYQSPGGLPTTLYVKDSLTLYFKDGYRQLHLKLVTNQTPQSVVYHNRKYRDTGQRTGPASLTEKQPIDVPEHVLQTYVGSYQTKQFLFVIKIENGKLWAGPDGSDMMPLTPYAKNKFFVPELGAEIDFEVLDEKSVNVRILLEGELYQGVRL